MIKSRYDDTCILHNVDKGQDIEAEILEFRPLVSLSVSIQRKIKLTLSYVTNKKMYVGSMAGLEFISKGPKETVTYQGRGR